MSTQTESQKKPSWDLDTARRHVGATGRYQIMVFFLQGAMYCTLAFHFLAPVFLDPDNQYGTFKVPGTLLDWQDLKVLTTSDFTTATPVDTPPHHCKIPQNTTKNETIPKIIWEGQLVDDNCHVYANFSYTTNQTIPCPDGWEFDRNAGYIATVVTDFNLYCDRSIVVEISLMISSGVMAFFQIFANKLADVLGRKTMFLFGCTFRSIFGVAKAFSPNMITYIVIDACMQAAQTGFASMLLLLNIELFPPEHRSLGATSVEFFWLVSCLLTSIYVYLFRDWRVLQIVLHAPLALGVLYYWLIPESLPWLMSKGKYREAQKILERAGRINKRPLPPGFFDSEEGKKPLIPTTAMSTLSLTDNGKSLHSLGSRSSMFGSGPIWVRRIPESKDSSEMEVRKVIAGAEEGISRANTTFMDVLKSRKLLVYTIIFNALWLCNSIVYSALNLTVTYLSGDRYLNFFLLSLAELPAVLCFHVALNRIGRRIPLCLFHIIAGVALLLTLVEAFGVEAKVFVITMNFVGKFGITASYCTILVYTPEVYPTSVRSVFYGICMFSALTGNLIVPYCRPLELSIPGLVRGMCGSASIIVGLLVLVLPETLCRALPETIADVEGWARTVPKADRAQFMALGKSNNTEDTYKDKDSQ